MTDRFPAWADNAPRVIEALYENMSADEARPTAVLLDRLVESGIDVSLDEMLGLLVGGLRSGVVEFDFFATPPGWRVR